MEKKYFYEVFENMSRQGPGSNTATKKAFRMIKGYLPDDPKIIDIGCGKGTQTIQISEMVDADIIAIDNHPFFIEFLKNRTELKTRCARIIPKTGDMTKLKYKKEQFDLVWSEGAIFIIGFKKGLEYWKKFIKHEGFLVVTEAVWLKNDIPEELKKFWDQEYPEIGTIDEKKEIIQKAGYGLFSHFSLPSKAWVDFYGNMANEIENARKKYMDNQKAQEVYNKLQYEIDMFNKYEGYYGYEFFIMMNK